MGSPGSQARASSMMASAAGSMSGRHQRIASEQVSWWPVHEFLEAVLAQANTGPLPPAGTPAWCELATGDPRKLLALAAAGEHHVLRIETAQVAMAEASRSISASEDWGHIGRRNWEREDFCRQRPWLRRAVL